MEFFHNELHSFSNDNDKLMEFSPMDDFYDWAPLLSNQQLFFINDLPEVDNEFEDLPPLDELNKVEKDFKKEIQEEEEEEDNQEQKRLLLLSELVPSSSSSIGTKKKKNELDFDEIKKHFDLPITEAANKMNIGVTLLKRRCRELNINRWPHRKIRSLHLLIQNLKEMGLDNEVEMLEQETKMMEKIPGMELTKETKRLRQACFKANFKKRRFLASKSY
ncbi:hypothetical protein PIB30_074986 [Stylosanthes scabra]|uniref:RWP-RK domain-containing protein n=1 Tax=Stylosanthes scabra TaxID=79078 RepID=A0ABU6YSG5_9FABA|nr:hypothetical protein [Stylosanthes scabra]